MKALKENVKCIYGPSLKYGNKKSFSFSDWWTKENKTVNRLLKQALCMVLDLSNSGIIYEVGESLTRSWTLMLDHMIAHQFYSPFRR